MTPPGTATLMLELNKRNTALTAEKADLLRKLSHCQEELTLADEMATLLREQLKACTARTASNPPCSPQLFAFSRLSAGGG